MKFLEVIMEHLRFKNKLILDYSITAVGENPHQSITAV